MTQPNYTATSDIASVAMPKRKAGSRFTSGHLLMVVSALMAFLLTMVVLGSKSKTVVVYVAKDDIVAGKLISEGQFIPKQVASSSLDGEYVKKETLVSGKNFASRSIQKGEPLTKGALTPEANKSDVRLQSIPISKTLAVNGAIAKGDRIDIIVTPEDECAFRALRNLEVVTTPTSSGGGALGGGSSSYSLTVSIVRSGDDLILAGIIAAGKFQVVKSTGTNDGNIINTDPQCGTAPEDGDNSDNGDA